jgi:GTP pyrophosphokinase
MDIEKVYDLVAMRIIVSTVPECYAALGLIHEKWPPLPGRIKDYIAMPKPNGYRSLHTTVLGPDGRKTEFQIRTPEMHEENERGIAAHWLYEQKKRGESVSAKKLTSEIAWVQQLRSWQENLFGPPGAKLSEGGPQNGARGGGNDEEFLRSLKIDFFKDRIFAITPKGDVIDLPFGATPVDFAYRIHTEIGASCVGAKVNDEFTPLDHLLKSGDVVEILTQKNKNPSEDWLKFVKTATAREHIRATLKDKDALRKGVRAPKKAEFKVTVEDRVGLIKDVSSTIARSHLNIIDFHVYNPAGGRFPVINAGVATTDKQKIEKLTLKLKGIKGVREVNHKLV